MMVIDASFRLRMSILASGLGLACLLYLVSGASKLIDPENHRTVNGTLQGLGGKRSALLTVVSQGQVYVCSFSRCSYPDWQLDEGRQVIGILNQSGELVDVRVDGASRMARRGSNEIRLALAFLGLPSGVIWLGLYISKRRHGGSIWR